MWKAFSLSPQGNMLIASKSWSDFAATIPLIRSFSLGDNFPPEYPIFAGSPIRYHFGFYFLVGLVEKVGLPIDIALNTLSALGFALMLFLIYKITTKFFKNTLAGHLAMVFTLFNGSLSFTNFFAKNPLSTLTPSQIVNNTNFPSFGPYDGSLVSAFWNLNIYTNQRHLAISYAAYLFFIYFILTHTRTIEKSRIWLSIGIGIGIGSFVFVHSVVFGAMLLATIGAFVTIPKIRGKMLVSGVVAFLLALPQIMYMGNSQVEHAFIKLGYLLTDPTLKEFLVYWFFNLGIFSILIPMAFIFSNIVQKKLFLFFLPYFVIGNFFQFSPEIAANHKFFNLFIIGGNIIVAGFLVNLWTSNKLARALIVTIFPLTILSGVIDLFPILNDTKMTIEDIPNNKTAEFIKKHTPKTSVFLNASFLYDPASLAGRKIYMGWPYFSWSAGYNTTKRNVNMTNILDPQNGLAVCRLLNKEGIDYIELQKPTSLEGMNINYSFFNTNFKKVYFDPDTNITIYGVREFCSDNPN